MATLLVAGTAAAQPVDQGPPVDRAATAPPSAPPVAAAGTCEVAIVRAPPEVRRAIESWVHNEASCKIALDVRVIPTADGLYLLARESTGRVHERVVPDAQSAGVLVASWVADDSLEAVPPPPRAEATLDVPAPAPPSATAQVECAGPSCRRPAPASGGIRWAIGVTGLGNDISGPRLRGEVGVVRLGPLELEAIVAAAYSTFTVDPSFTQTQFHRVDGRALVGLSWTFHSDAWQLRLQAAGGGVWARRLHEVDWAPDNSRALALEASVMLGYRLSDDWALGIAPVETLYRSTKPFRDPYAALPDSDFGVLLELRHGS